jgi:hypothetical protein
MSMWLGSRVGVSSIAGKLSILEIVIGYDVIVALKPSGTIGYSSEELLPLVTTFRMNL